MDSPGGPTYLDERRILQSGESFMEAGRPTERGGTWQASTVKRIVGERYVEGITL